MTAITSGSSAAVTVTSNQQIAINSAPNAKAYIEATSGVPGATSKMKLANHPGGYGIYGPFGAGTVTIYAVGGDVVYDAADPLRSADSTDVTPAQVFATVSGPGDVRQGAPAVALGDSRHALGWTAAAFLAAGYLPVLNQLLGGVFDLRACYAVSGQTSSHVKAVQLPQVLAMSPLPAYAFIDVGHNDIVAGSTAETVFDTVSSVIASLNAVGVKTILSTSGTSTTIAASAVFSANLRRLNSLYKTSGAALAGVAAVIDPYSAVVDYTTGSYSSAYYQADNVHYNPEGARRIAVLCAQQLTQLVSTLPAPFIFESANGEQLIPNPRLIGNNASGANGFALGGNNTGQGPNRFTSKSMTATYGTGGQAALVGATSVTPRTDTRAGQLVKIDHTTGTVDYELTAIQVNITLKNWSSNLAVTQLDRILPTVANGYQYRVVTAGNLFTGADPTASWSTTLGTQFASGSATLEVVRAINIGDQVQAVAEVFCDSWSGAAAPIVSVAFLTSGSVNLNTVYGNLANSGSGLPTSVPASQVIRTRPAVIPATTGIISIFVGMCALNGVTGNWYLGGLELQLYT